jgi:hypothetical protein
MIFDTTDLEMWRQSQGVPTKYISGVHTVLCSKCANLLEVWLKAQPIWAEYLKTQAKGKRLQAELENGSRPAGEVEREIVEFETVEEAAWQAKAFPIIKSWIDARKDVVGVANKVRTDEQKVRRDAAKAERDRLKGEAKK